MAVKIFPSEIVVINSGAAGFTDSFKLNIQVADSVAAQSDAATFALALAEAESIAAQTEAVSLGISGAGLNDSNASPTDARSALLRVWLSGSAGSGVTNPANANGQNDGAVATLQTALAGASTITMTSNIGSNIGTIAFTAVLYRGWFEAKTTLLTSTVKIVAHSSTGAFADITMFTQSATNGDTNHLAGDFTFDLFAAGVNTLAKLQSLRILHSTTDAVAGVTPAVLTVDAGAADISGVTI